MKIGDKVHTRSEFKKIYKNEKITKEFQEFPEVAKLRINEIEESKHNKGENFPNDKLLNSQKVKEIKLREKYFIRKKSATANCPNTSNFQEYLNTQLNHSKFLFEQKDIINKIQVDRNELNCHHPDNDAENIDKKEIIPMEIYNSRFLEEKKETKKAIKERKRCLTSNCTRLHYGKGYCKSCYYRFAYKKKCIECGLLKPYKGNGYCQSCYFKFQNKHICIRCGFSKPYHAKKHCKSCYSKYVHVENKKTCIGCGLLRPHIGKGYCKTCYYKYENKKKCIGCKLLKPHIAKGLCKCCYAKKLYWRK